MSLPRSWNAAALALVLVVGTQDSLHAQVVEQRESEANPAVAIFRATLFGAGTGLLLGGAYALVEDEPDLDTGEILKWGVAGGAAAGAVVGLIYVATRAGPQGDAEEVGLIDVRDGNVHLSVPTVRRGAIEDAGGRSHRTIEASLLQARF